MPFQRDTHPYIEVVYIAADGSYFRATLNEFVSKMWQFQDASSGKTYGAHKIDSTRPLMDDDIASYVQSVPEKWGLMAAGEFSPDTGFRLYRK